MSDDIEIQLNMKYDTSEDLPKSITEFQSGEPFNDFLEQLLEDMEEGTPVAHVIAHTVMELFQPGFVIIGSPNTTKTEDGHNIPTSLGVSVGGNGEITKGDIVILLREFCDSLEAADNPESLFNE